MAKNKVTMFEIPSSDFKKSKEFYGKIFDWDIQMYGDEGAMANTVAVDEDEYPTETGGINGGFYKREHKDQQPSIVVETESIDETLKKVEANGGKTTTAKHQVGEWGYMADFKDPEGNEIALWQRPV